MIDVEITELIKQQIIILNDESKKEPCLIEEKIAIANAISKLASVIKV